MKQTTRYFYSGIDNKYYVRLVRWLLFGWLSNKGKYFATFNISEKSFFY